MRGEQAVAEALSEAADSGFRAFHDLQTDSNGNLDHVAIGTRGVFLIETKARRKRGGNNGQAAHEVVFDGETLQFPRRREPTKPKVWSSSPTMGRSLSRIAMSKAKEKKSSGINPKRKGESVALKTPDFLAEQAEQIRQILPHVFTEGKIDVEKLRAALGDSADERPERYSFTWAGKRAGI